MADESRAPNVLVGLSLVVAALGLADLLEAVAGGFTLLISPVIGAVMGWLAYRKGAARFLSLFAVAANCALLVATVVAIVVFGGT